MKDAARVLSASFALSLAIPAPAVAQRGLEFELQPGLSITDFVSVPEGTVSNSAFSLRFATRFPTSIRWLTPIVGAVFLPYGSTQNTTRNTDAPTLFAGNIFPVVRSSSTSGWFTVELPVVIAHAPGTDPSGNSREYGRDLVVLPTVYLHLGARALNDLGKLWSKLNVFAQLEQNLTPNRDPASGDRDYFNPVATIGLSFIIGAPQN